MKKPAVPAKARSVAASNSKSAPAVAKKPAVKSKSATAKTKPPVAAKAKPVATVKKTAAAKPAAANKSKPAAIANPASPPKEKTKKPKLVRDSFTMPEAEYDVLDRVKKECLKAGVEIKKSQLLRIGVALISRMDLASLKSVLAALPPLKTGRPKKN